MGERHALIARNLHFDLVGLCDVRRDRLEEVGRRLGLSHSALFEKADRLFTETSPDLVVIASTAPSHAALTEDAVGAGAQMILCEKPMATSIVECDRMIAVCQRANVKLAINHQMRFMELYKITEEAINDSVFSPWTSMTVVGGNLGLAMNGVHYFDLFRWFSGEEIHSLCAWFSPERVPNPRGAEFEDYAGSIRAETVSGRRLYLEISADQGHGVHVIYAGRGGSLISDELNGVMRITARRPEDRDLPTTRYATDSVVTTREFAPADVIDPTAAVLRALIDGADYPRGEDGRHALRAFVAACVSNEAGHVEMAVDESLPSDRTFPIA